MGFLEALSRARLSLGIVLCCNEKSREYYNSMIDGYRAAIEQGLVEVALPPWHPQLSNLITMPSNPTPSAEFVVGEKEKKVEEQDPRKFHNWAGRGAAHLFLPKIKENPLVARVKVLEEKVMVSDARITELEKKVCDSEKRYAELEQKVSRLLQTEATKSVSLPSDPNVLDSGCQVVAEVGSDPRDNGDRKMIWT